MKNIKNYEFILSSEIIINNGFDSMINWLQSRSIDNVMLITGPNLHKLGVEQKIENELKKGNIIINHVFKDIPNDSSIAVVGEIADRIFQTKSDAIIAVGGGSILDTAKAVKLAVNNSNGSLSGGIDSEKTLKLKIPLICIPTTAGTGSEITKVVVIYDEVNKRKEEILSSELIPEFVLLTPHFIKTLPPKATFTGMMDALTHSIEAITSLERNSISDAYAKSAIKLIIDNMDEIIENPQNEELRQISLTAACMAGIAFSNAMVGLAHAIAHSLGAVLKIPHDLACSLCLVEVMKYNFDKCYNQYSEIINFLSANKEKNNKENAKKVIDIISKKLNFYYKKFDINQRLSYYGAAESNVYEIVDKAYYDGARLTNAREVARDDIEAIIRKLM